MHVSCDKSQLPVHGFYGVRPCNRPYKLFMGCVVLLEHKRYPQSGPARLIQHSPPLAFGVALLIYELDAFLVDQEV